MPWRVIVHDFNKFRVPEPTPDETLEKRLNDEKFTTIDKVVATTFSYEDDSYEDEPVLRLIIIGHTLEKGAADGHNA